MSSHQNNQGNMPATNKPAAEGEEENMGISALLDDEISSADFTILSAQFSANPSLMGALKTQQYVRDAMAGFSCPDYLYTERIMSFIQRSANGK
jgi:hypothetical protein